MCSLTFSALAALVAGFGNHACNGEEALLEDFESEALLLHKIGEQQGGASTEGESECELGGGITNRRLRDAVVTSRAVVSRASGNRWDRDRG